VQTTSAYLQNAGSVQVPGAAKVCTLWYPDTPLFGVITLFVPLDKSLIWLTTLPVISLPEMVR
jgi:hypothetical protein